MDPYHEDSDNFPKSESEDDDVSKLSIDGVLPISRLDLFAEILLRKQHGEVPKDKTKGGNMSSLYFGEAGHRSGVKFQDESVSKALIKRQRFEVQPEDTKVTIQMFPILPSAETDFPQQTKSFMSILSTQSPVEKNIPNSIKTSAKTFFPKKINAQYPRQRHLRHLRIANAISSSTVHRLFWGEDEIRWCFR